MNSQKRWFDFWALLAFIGVLPIALILGGQKLIEDKQADFNDELIIKRLKKGIFRLKSEGSQEAFLQKELNFFYGLLAEKKINSENIEEYLSYLKKRGLGFFKVRFFTDKNEQLNFKGESKEYKSFVQKIYKALIQPEIENKSSLLTKYKSLFEAFLGDVNPSNLIYGKSSLIKVFLKKKPGYFYWNTFYGGKAGNKYLGGMVVYFRTDQIPQNISFKLLCRDLSKEDLHNSIWGKIDLFNEQMSIPSENELAQKRLNFSEVKNKILELQRSFLSHGKSSAGVLAIEQTDPTSILYGIKLTSDDNKGKDFFILKLLAMVFIVATGKFLFNQIIAGKNSGLFYRKNFLFLIFLLVFFPLVAFFFVSYQYIEARKEVLNQKSFIDISNFIENVDESYNLAVASLKREYQKLANLVAYDSSKFPGLHSECNKMQKAEKLSSIFIANKEGKVIFENQYMDKVGVFLKKLVPTLARKLFFNFSGYKASFKAQMNDMMVKSFADNLSEILSESGGNSSFLENFEKLNSINEFWLGKHRYYVFSKFVKRKNEDLLMLIVQKSTKFAENFLKKQIKRNMFESERIQPIKLGMIPRVKNRQPFPGELIKYPFVKRMHEKVVSTEMQQQAIEQISDGNALIVVSPLKQVSNYILIGMYPEKMIDEKMKPIELFAGLIGLVFACLSIILGYRISKQLQVA